MSFLPRWSSSLAIRQARPLATPAIRLHAPRRTLFKAAKACQSATSAQPSVGSDYGDPSVHHSQVTVGLRASDPSQVRRPGQVAKDEDIYTYSGLRIVSTNNYWTVHSPPSDCKKSPYIDVADHRSAVTSEPVWDGKDLYFSNPNNGLSEPVYVSNTSYQCVN